MTFFVDGQEATFLGPTATRSRTLDNVPAERAPFASGSDQNCVAYGRSGRGAEGISGAPGSPPAQGAEWRDCVVCALYAVANAEYTSEQVSVSREQLSVSRLRIASLP